MMSFIENTFANYDPVDSDLTKTLPKINERLCQLPEKKNFDTMFTLAPEQVTFRRSSYELSKENFSFSRKWYAECRR